MIHKYLIEIMYYCIIFHDKKNEIFMQTKTTLIEKYLLNAIERGEYMTGQPIPTRNQLAQMAGWKVAEVVEPSCGKSFADRQALKD